MFSACNLNDFPSMGSTNSVCSDKPHDSVLSKSAMKACSSHRQAGVDLVDDQEARGVQHGLRLGRRQDLSQRPRRRNQHRRLRTRNFVLCQKISRQQSVIKERCHMLPRKKV